MWNEKCLAWLLWNQLSDLLVCNKLADLLVYNQLADLERSRLLVTQETRKEVHDSRRARLLCDHVDGLAGA